MTEERDRPPAGARRAVERLDSGDRRFILACLVAIAGAAAVTAAFYTRAFPEASIEFRVSRGQARVLGEKFLADRGRSTAGNVFASRFGVDDDAKVYLERELGLERASKLYGGEAKVWRWDLRWFRSQEKEEERVSISPRGDLVAWDSVRKEGAPGESLPRETARARASAFLTSRGLDAAALVPIEAFPTKRPKRTDWTFVDERPGWKMKEATVRYRTVVVGGEVAGFREFVHVPEAWDRDYRTLRSKNEAAGQAATLGFMVTALAMIGVLISRIVRKDVRWGLVAGFGAVGFVLALLSALNDLPLTLYRYDTASSLSSHVVGQVILGILGAVGIGAGIAIVVASAEPLYRERFPAHPSLAAIFSKRGIATKRFFRSVLLGYTLVAFFVAYQSAFYVIAAKLGAWAPAEVPYSDMLSTAFPWATVLLIGFLPAVTEEGMSRMFSIPFLDSLGTGRFLAVVIPAFIWGFGHSAYPNQPFYIRGIEVGCAGVLIGFLMLRFGVLPLLVWHFTVDALYTALVLIRSHNSYYVVSGAIAAGILLVPLVASVVLAIRRGGFEPDDGLSNADAGTAPPIPPRPIAAEPSTPVRAVPVRTLAAAAAAAVVLSAAWLAPSKPTSPVRDSIGRARAKEIAVSFLRANGVDASRFLPVGYTGTGFAEDSEVRDSAPAEDGGMPGFSAGAARYVVGRAGPDAYRRLGEGALPLNFWVLRFVEPGKKEEWKVFVDPRRARVVGFLNPVEEQAAAGAAPSDARARARALSAAAALGYPPGYTVLEVGSNTRPKRVDTTVVLESRAAAVGESAPRLTAVFHGSRLAAFYPSIHVPEPFLEADRRQSIGDWLVLGLRVVAAGSLLGLGIVLFLRAVRKPEIRWRSLLRPLVPLAVIAGAAFLNRYPVFLRLYSTEIPMSTFRFGIGVTLAILLMLVTAAAVVPLVLVSAARPGWRRALASQGGLRDAFLRAAVAAAGLAGLERAIAYVERSVSLLYHPSPALPAELETAFPAWTPVSSGAFGLALAAAAAAAVALGARDPAFRKTPARVALVVALAIALIPSGARSPLEFAWGLSASLLVAGWLAVSAFLLLRDHIAAWVIYAALVFGGAAALRLIVQPARPDAVFGWIGLALVFGAAAALIRSARREPSIPAPAPASPATTVPEVS